MKSVINLLSSVTNATDRNKLTWAQNGVKSYVTELPNKYKITVWAWTDETSNSPGVTVQLIDLLGNVIDEDTADQFAPDFADLHKFYQMARRSANKVNEVIESLQMDLLKLG
jgi:hypothetical protein